MKKLTIGWSPAAKGTRDGEAVPMILETPSLSRATTTMIAGITSPPSSPRPQPSSTTSTPKPPLPISNPPLRQPPNPVAHTVHTHIGPM